MNLRIDPGDYALLDALLAQALRQTDAQLSDAGHLTAGPTAYELAERARRLRDLQRRMSRAVLRQREKERS